MEFTALDAANYARLSYGLQKQVRDGLISDYNQTKVLEQLEISLPNEKLDYSNILIQQAFKSDLGAECLLKIHQGSLTIAVTGTNSFQDWCFNIDYFLDLIKEEINFFFYKKHPVFLQYKDLFESLKPKIADLLNIYDRLSQKNIFPKIKNIYLTGHSSGGMIAQHLIIWLALRYKNFYSDDQNFSRNLYTFGSPYVARRENLNYNNYIYCKDKYRQNSIIDKLNFFDSYLSETILDNELFNLLNIKVERYAIANDPVSEILPILLKRKRYDLTILPASPWYKYPHSINLYIEKLKTIL